MIAIINTYNKDYTYHREGNIITTCYKKELISEIDYSNPLSPIILRKFTFNKNMKLIRGEYGGGQWFEYKYDKNNNCIETTNWLGQWTKYKHDENNNLIKVENELNYWGCFTYDENNNKIKEERSTGEIILWEYDQINNRMTEISKNSFRNYPCEFNEKGKMIRVLI